MNLLNNIAAVVCLLALSASAWASSGYIHDASGSVSLAMDKGTPRWAKINDRVTTGTVIRTGKGSYAVLKFEDGQVVSLQADTTFQVRKYIYAPRSPQDSSILFTMFKGGMRFVTGLIGKQNKEAFRLATPSATIGIRGTDAMAVMNTNGLSTHVVQGSIGVTNVTGTTVLGAGQTAVTSSATAATSQVSAASQAGTFGQLNSITLPPSTPTTLPQAPAPGAGGTLNGASTVSTAGGTAAGGAATTSATAVGGMSTTAAVATGIGVAAGVAAIVNATTTTHH